MRVVMRLDYATMNFSAGMMSVDEVSNKLAGSSEVFCWTKKGITDNAPLYSPLGLRYMHNNGYAPMPHKLEVSGVGCRKFLYTLPQLRTEDMRFSRLDFAFDLIMKRDAWKDFLGNCFVASLFSDRNYKRYKLSGTGEAMTVYIGSRISPKYFRIYNKTLQDAKYEYRDGDGNVHDLAEDECVIRYEVELHRWKATGKELRIFDPSPCFDWYYSDDPADHERLHEEIKRMWISFGDDVLLPEGFETMEIVDLTQLEANVKFCSKNAEVSNEALQRVQDALHDYPHSFDRTLSFVVDRFGKYIPYILADDDYREACFRACENKFGFVPDFYMESVKRYNYDDDLQDIAMDIPQDWIESEPEDQLLIDSDFERRCNQWL